jgi:hypothetical protein
VFAILSRALSVLLFLLFSCVLYVCFPSTLSFPPLPLFRSEGCLLSFRALSPLLFLFVFSQFLDTRPTVNITKSHVTQAWMDECLGRMRTIVVLSEPQTTASLTVTALKRVGAVDAAFGEFKHTPPSPSYLRENAITTS